MTAFRLSNLIVLLVVVIAAAIAAILLGRTVSLAQNINSKAGNIANTGRGINIATDSVIQLTRTNRTAGSILRSAEPLEQQLDQIIGEARSIDNTASGILGNATSINGTARDILGNARTIEETAGGIGGTALAINETAEDIDETAAGISGTAGQILGTARAINTHVRLINQYLDETLCIAGGRPRPPRADSRRRCDAAVRRRGGIKGDTGNILDNAISAHDTAACIDQKLGGSTGNDGHCLGRNGLATPAARDREAAERGAGEEGRGGSSAQGHDGGLRIPNVGLPLELPKIPETKLPDLKVPEVQRLPNDVKLPALPPNAPAVP